MGVSFSATVVYGIPVVVRQRLQEETKYNPDTGVPYKKLKAILENVCGEKVIDTEEFYDRKLPVQYYSCGLESPDPGEKIGIIGIQLARTEGCEVTLIPYNAEKFKSAIEYFKAQGIEGVADLYLVGYVG